MSRGELLASEEVCLFANEQQSVSSNEWTGTKRSPGVNGTKRFPFRSLLRLLQIRKTVRCERFAHPLLPIFVHWMESWARKVDWYLFSGRRSEVPKAHRRFVDMLFPDPLCPRPVQHEISDKDRQASVFFMLSGPATECKMCVYPKCSAGDGRTGS